MYLANLPTNLSAGKINYIISSNNAVARLLLAPWMLHLLISQFDIILCSDDWAFERAERRN